jgi:hypothetical protein
MTGRRGRRRHQLLDDLKEKTRYRKLKEEALDPPCGELAFEGATDLSYERIQNECTHNMHQYLKFILFCKE